MSGAMKERMWRQLKKIDRLDPVALFELYALATEYGLHYIAAEASSRLGEGIHRFELYDTNVAVPEDFSQTLRSLPYYPRACRMLATWTIDPQRKAAVEAAGAELARELEEITGRPFE